MQSTQHFTGLTMPVFAAFGWAGEEAAIKFALSQLELFIRELHVHLPREMREKLPYYGLNREMQSVFLAADEQTERDAYVAFFARPLSLEIQFGLMDKAVLGKGLKAASKDLLRTHRLFTELGPDWTLRVQQMHVDDETGEASHYQDLFKDSVGQLSLEVANELFPKAEFLNSDPKWKTPIYLSRKISSEQVAAMGTAVLQVMTENIGSLLPVLDLLTGREARKSRPKAKARKVVAPVAEELSPELQQAEETFTYVAELKPLHLRKGFINLTPRHWPFFAINSRTETREVTVYYNGVYDKECTVWRLVPDDTARIVLSSAVHDWLEDNFGPEDKIKVTAFKLDGDEIQINLQPAA
ncbi:MAG: hypothetical protein D6706_00105 [Chloroflexi bacterium]|nr:MAG: hypothetical protein D6706_00105 [Chloroflexota bacterium]